MHNTKFDPNEESYTGLDKLARQQAWADVQTRYNCVIVDSAFPDEAPWGPNRHKWIVSNAETGNAPADFYQLPVGWLSPVIAGNAIVDVGAYYSKWGKKQMNPVQKAVSTIKGNLYGVSEGNDTTAIYADLGIYFNLGMLETYKIENPAKLFNEGKWNYSTFEQWVASTRALLPDDYFVLAGHPYYYWVGMANAAGVKIADNVAGKVNIYDPVAETAAATLRTLYLTGAFEKTPTWAESDGAFIAGKSLCTTGFRWYCKSTTRWPSDAWGDDTRFGYVPFPYPDTMTKEQTRVNTGGEEVVWTLAGQRQRPSYVTEEDLYRVMVDLFILTRKYQESDPAFDADGLKQQVVSKALDDPESIEAALYFTVDKAIVDVCHLFYDSISGSPLDDRVYSIVTTGADYHEKFGECYDSYENTFLGLYGLA